MIRRLHSFAAPCSPCRQRHRTRSPSTARARTALALLAVIAAWGGLDGTSVALAAADGNSSLADLPLEELMRIEVVSAGRKAQTLSDVAAAAFVIGQDDILRSGARTLPEALRLAPGVDVAQLSAGRWAVGVRGGAARFTNNLLVLIDGRSAYSPLFSGVFWEAERVPLDQIDRIEVIRGPAGAVWGANAVNGVINIITKRAERTLGAQASVTLSSDSQAAVSVRQGMDLSLDSQVRLWAQTDGAGPSRTPAGQPANDRYLVALAGARWDRGLADGGALSMQSQYTRSRVNDSWRTFSATVPGYAQLMPAPQNLQRFWTLAGYQQPLSNGSDLRLQATFNLEAGEQSGYARYQDHGFDLDAQHRWQPGNGHDLTWGAGLNVYSDHLSNTQLLAFSPDHRTLTSWRLFAQDEYALVPQQWLLTGGLRVDRNPYAGVQPEPNLRLLWKINPQTSVWLAASRAMRVPSRGEEDSTIDSGVYPASATGLPLPLRLQIQPGESASIVEKVSALEAGWRGRPWQNLSLDGAVFVAHYRPLSETPRLDPSRVSVSMGPYGPYLLGPISETRGSATTRGLELAADWRIQPSWRVQGSYALLDVSTTARSHGNYQPLAASSRTLLSLRQSFDLAAGLSLDAWLRHASKRDYGVPLWPTTPARSTLDLSLRWRATPATLLSATAHNLGHRRQQEIAQDFGLSQLTTAARALVFRAELAY